MSTHQRDAELINSLGGPSKVAERLGMNKRGGAQRVQNWLTRGIPSKIKVDHPDLFIPSMGQGVVNKPPAEGPPQDATRTGIVRRQDPRRDGDIQDDSGRRKNPPSPALDGAATQQVK